MYGVNMLKNRIDKYLVRASYPRPVHVTVDKYLVRASYPRPVHVTVDRVNVSVKYSSSQHCQRTVFSGYTLVAET